MDRQEEIKDENIAREVQMGFWQGLRMYPNAAAWSLLLSSSIIMEGYDTALLGSFFAFPQFKERYGELLSSGQYQIPTAWQIGLSNGGQIGSILGLLLNGYLCDTIGYKKTYIAGMSLMTVAIFFPFLATSLRILLIGEILSGIAWGIFQTLSVAYASEVCPVCLRGYLTTYVNSCWVIGELLAGGVVRGMLHRQDEWSYRIPFALQWMFIPPLVLGVIFAPEGPWWLVRHDRIEEATQVVRRLMSAAERSDESNVESKIAEMKLTNEHEKALSAGTTYKDCFRGTDLRRTEVACCTWLAQQLSGSILMGASTYFLSNAGLPVQQVYNVVVGQRVIGLVGTLLSWILISYYGRRVLYTSGLCGQFVILLIIGGLGFAPPNSTIVQAKRSESSSAGAVIPVNTGASWAVGSLVLVFTLVYDTMVGPLCYAIVGECSATRLRRKTTAIARIAYNIAGVGVNVMTPIMLNPAAANLGAKSGLVWAGPALVCITWCYFRLPETGNRTYRQLNLLFENKVSARKFNRTEVDEVVAPRSNSASLDVEGGRTTESFNQVDVVGKS